MDKCAPSHLQDGRTSRLRIDQQRPKSSRAVLRVESYIVGNLDGDLSLKVLAEQAGLSPFHFARLFRNVTGRTPHRYVMERRVEGAVTMLRESAMSLSEVALECGFASQSHFTTVFRQHIGVTPARYRKAALRNAT